MTWFQRPPCPGHTLIVGEPELGTTALGDATYRFLVHLERPRGRAHLQHGVTVTQSVPLALGSGAGSPALVLALLPAMALGVRLRVDAPVSPLLLAGLELVQDVFASWFPRLSRVEIEAPPARPEPRPTGRTACFFSAGVDGFATLQRHLCEIDQLVLLHGFDLDLERTEHRAVTEAHVERIAADVGRELVVMQTDIRSFGDDYAPWHVFCGPVLAACAQLLEGVCDRMLIASSNSHADFHHFGTNALTDPALSTEGVALAYVDGDLQRAEKVARLAGWDYALEHLRVCWAMEGSTLNCCRCDKCLRTMTALWAVGALERAPTFGEPLEPARVAAYAIAPNHADFVLENLALAHARGLGDHPLVHAWRTCLERAAAAAAPRTAEGLRAAVHADPLLGA